MKKRGGVRKELMHRHHERPRVGNAVELVGTVREIEKRGKGERGREEEREREGGRERDREREREREHLALLSVTGSEKSSSSSDFFTGVSVLRGSVLLVALHERHELGEVNGVGFRVNLLYLSLNRALIEP